MHEKEWRNDVLQRIISHSLSNGVRTMSAWSELLMGSCKAFFLQMQPEFFAHMKIVWYLILIISLLVLGIFQNGAVIYQLVI